MTGDVGRDDIDAASARGLDREASAPYLNCPRCRLSIRLRGPSLRVLHCPRCVARTRTLVELFASALPAEQLYDDAVTLAGRDPSRRAHVPQPPDRARDDGWRSMDEPDLAMRGARSSRTASQPTGERRPSAGGSPGKEPMTELHVIPDERTTTWRVFETAAAAPLSEHTGATEAELAARARAADRDAERVVVHDRYHRTHDAAPSPVSAREQRARARQIALAREGARQLARARPR